MIIVSLVLNLIVLVPVTGSLLARATWTTSAFGTRTPARDILLAVYLAILAASAALLAGVLVVASGWVLGAVVALLAMQILYKVMTAFTVHHSLRNPVVISNLAIAVVHSVTIITVLPMLQ